MLEHEIEGLGDGGLAVAGKAFDLFEAAEDAAAWGGAAGEGSGARGEEALDGDVEGGGQAQGGFGGEAQAAAFVIGEQGLAEAGVGGEFDLGEAALLADGGEGVPEGKGGAAGHGAASVRPVYGGGGDGGEFAQNDA